MESSDIHGDQNFYSRRPLLPPTTSSPEIPDHNYPPAPPSDHPNTTSPQLPPKLPFLTTQNLHTATVNGFHRASDTGGGDPDEFYRDYRGVQQSAAGYTDINTNGMPATTSDSRGAPAFSRVNGTAATSRHPMIPGARSNINLKPTYRSASAPLDDRIALGNAKSTSALNGHSSQKQQPSVKDLLKRFDQNNGQSSVPPRKPSPRIVTRDLNGTGELRHQPGYQARTIASSQQSTSRVGAMARDGGPARVRSPPMSKASQRARFAAEDQHSNNTQSSVARTTRPRNLATSANAQASRSMTNLSPIAPSHPAPLPAGNTLFGEVNAAKHEFEIGHGIPRIVGRRTSESSIHPPSWLLDRNKLDEDFDASSPTTGWYRGATTLDVAASRAPRSSLGHNRNHSDMPDARVNNLEGINPTFSTTAATPTNPHETASRIPVKSNRYSGSSQSSSMSSSRDNSRATSPSGYQQSARFQRPDPKGWNTTSNSNASVPRSRTPTRPRGTARNSDVSAHSNASLKAYISAPLPKLSPPLRSSRPRLPVSSASTASSRQRAAERSGSPHQVRTGVKVTRTSPNEQAKSKKSPEHVLDQGPVDFEAHRAKIKRAYTKSLHESEQAEIRLANMRRLQERQAQNALASSDMKANDEVSQPKSPTELITAPPQPLHIDTSFASPQKTAERLAMQPAQDSPTLGVVPGTYMDDDEPPHSAISNSTEIENEPQTEAPRLSRMVSDQSIGPVMASNQTYFSDEHFSPEQAMFGISNLDQEIQIMLDATPTEAPRAVDTSRHDFQQPQSPAPPGAFRDSQSFEEYTQTVHAAIGMTSGRDDSMPLSPHSRPVTFFEDDQAPIEFNEPFRLENNGSSSDPEAAYRDELMSPTNPGTSETNSLNIAVAPPALAMNDVVQNAQHTPVADAGYESSEEFKGAHGHRHLEHDGLQSAPAGHRASHLSGWTDHSISTSGDYSEQENYHSLNQSVVSLDKDQERRPTPPPKEHNLTIIPGVPPKPDGYSPMPSPRFPNSSTQSLNPLFGQISPLSTGGSFESLINSAAPSIVSVTPLWPGYSSSTTGNSQAGDASPLPPTRTPPPIGPDTTPLSKQKTLSRGSSRKQLSNEESSIPTDVQPSPAAAANPTETAVDPETEAKTKKRLFHRRMLIKELVDTEAAYLKDMNIVEEIYKGTAEACPKLDANDISLLFRNSAKLIAFSTKFFEEIKSAAASVYSIRTKPRVGRTWTADEPGDRMSTANTLVEENDDQKDRKTFIGANFKKHVGEMKDIYANFLKNGDAASARLITLQTDPSVKVWLSECNLVAKDLTQAWDLDSLLVKPFQRVTRYNIILKDLSTSTPEDHPDYQALQVANTELTAALHHINQLKAQTQLAGKQLGRKRKESDVRLGIAKAFGRRSEKAPPSTSRPPDDEVYVKLHEKYGDDFLRLQVVLRDVEFYTRQCTTYVNDFLRYLSSIELIMRMSASSYPELESKWARFNMSMRDMGTIALEDHISSIRSKVIEPFEQVIKLYGPPGLTMKKRSKRRLDYEKYLNTKTKDPKIQEVVDQYDALNELLKLELPKLSALTEKIGKIALFQLVNIQAQWYHIWQEKVKVVLEESQMPKNVEVIVEMFSRDFKYAEARALELGIVNKTFGIDVKPRQSQSTQDDDSIRAKPRPSNLSGRSRGPSIASDNSPSLPTPDFAKRSSGHFTFSPIVTASPGLPQPYAGPAYSQHYRAGLPSSSATAETPPSSRPYSNPGRPSTSRSYTSDNGVPRLSTDHSTHSRRESASYYNPYQYDGPSSASRPYSGLFNSALPDGPEESQRSSRASSQDHGSNQFSPNVLYLAASLFEFNISATKSEAGYTYLTYSAGEIFDVLAEKGELWLAKNQDDPSNVVGWIWSKHFARLATD